MDASLRFWWGGEGTDGGKSTSRDLPPAAFWGDGETGEMARFPKKGIPKGLLRLSF